MRHACRAMTKTIVMMVAMVLLAGSAQAQGKKVKLTTLEWPPYTGETLPDKGASAVVVRKAFEAMGYTVEMEFMPWNRAVQTAKEDPAFSGYFPEYYSKENAADFVYSKPMGVGPLGLIERVDKPVTWNALDDLKPYGIGVVTGYVNTEAFDAKAAAGELKVEPSVDDVTNIRKLAMGRMDLAVIDRFVFNFLLATDASLADLKANVRFNEKLLEDKELFICFRKDAQGEEMARIFNEGLTKINWRELQESQIKQSLGK